MLPREKFNIEKTPKSFCYAVENDTFTRRCNVCGSVVLRQPLDNGYPYQCMACDEDRYEIETHIGDYHSDEEFEELLTDVRDLLLLDD